MLIPRRSRASLVPRSGYWLLALLVLTGCGTAERKTELPAEADAISRLLEEWNEARLNLKEATPLFLEGKAPTPQAFTAYGKFSYAIQGVPTVSGTSATIPISIIDDNEGMEVARKDWTFVKTESGWKIDSAPLP